MLVQVLILLVAVMPATPGDRRDDDAEAALAMARAKSSRLKESHASYAAAITEAARTGKPVLCSVGLDCSALCRLARPEVITCRERKVGDDPTPRTMLIIPDCQGKCWKVKTWSDVPTHDELRKAIDDGKKVVAANCPR